MAKIKTSDTRIKPEPVEKKTYQGNSKRTRFSATSANKAKKKYRGQGK